ncbi:uracil-DNA glycosylase [Gymnodinialimonas ceratoperidinii]|uniref:uracil-DNA glycosylase n=1 Tax=Gymnodinialimonas ceratoperidinii TaxID=2856823 RepID=A0A8F6TZJ3_9RHOB|nr:uracil-DNA glycosylase [Gymnodinialimonas ceratoperidinii]QXT41338.1 uracil-DNA glycosylase [Gymnodinialimonas ceratoperidinii]
MDGWSYWDTLAALEWQVELGADEAMLDAPLDRFSLPNPVKMPKPEPAKPVGQPGRGASSAPSTPAPLRPAAPEIDAVAIARQLAGSAETLKALREAMALFDHCQLKRGARNLVFADGAPSARVMVVGEAPDRDEDRAGTPFVGPVGQMLDRMFAAIGLDRAAEGAAGLYLTNVLPWRPPQNRDPRPDELAMMAPFLLRHIDLVDPDIVVLMGNHPCAGLLGRQGIKRMRGTWEAVGGREAMPMCHPAHLLRNPEAKREAWADLLAIKARLA